MCMYVCMGLFNTQDTDAELSEVFLVSLISVTLDPSEDGDVPPSIGDNDQAQVTILPNDNPEGILNFAQTRFWHTTHTLCTLIL